jgi:hypothetical protein
MSTDVKLTKPQAELLRLFAITGSRTRWDKYKPGRKLQELGFIVRKTHYGSHDKYALTDEGRAWLAANKEKQDGKPKE